MQHKPQSCNKRSDIAVSRTLFLDGRSGSGKKSRRFRILVNKKEWWLPYRLFICLALLARHYQTHRAIHLSADMIEPSGNPHKTMHRLKALLSGSGIEIQSWHNRGYRLVDIKTVKWNRKQLKKFPELMRLFEE